MVTETMMLVIGVVTGILLYRLVDHRRRKLELNLLDNMDIAAEVAKVVPYRFNYRTWKMDGPKQLNEFWTIKDGKGLEAKDVVIPEDIEICTQKYEAVIANKIPHAIIPYRMMKPDGLHYYRLFMRKSRTIANTITGLIQDITQLVQTQKLQESVTELWQISVNSGPAMMFIKAADDHFHYLQCNARFASFVGRTPEDIVGQTDADIFNRPEDADNFRLWDQQIMDSGTFQEFHEKAVDAEGNLHYLATVKIPSTDREGRPLLIGISIDETESQKNSIVLRELSDIRRIVSFAFEQLFSPDNIKSSIQKIMKQVCEFIGATCSYFCCLDNLTGAIRLYTSYISDDESSMCNGKTTLIEDFNVSLWYRTALNSNIVESLHCDFSDSNDCEYAKIHCPGIYEKRQEFDIRGVYINQISVEGTPWGCIGFITQHHPLKELTLNEKNMLKMIGHIIEMSITRKQTQERLKHALQEAQAAAQTKSNFLAIMSHEIRTPLNAVLGFADLLLDSHLNPDTREEYLKNISVAGNALLTLINDILDLSKLSVGKMSFTLKATVLLELVEHVRLIFQPQFKTKNVQFVINVSPDFPTVWIDQSRIRQILFNLIGNAIKFTNSGSVTVNLVFQKNTKGEGTLTLSVCDTGIGIPEHILPNLSKPFSQANEMRGTIASNNGTGLGLVICKRMLECMNGQLLISSTLGQGSVFTAQLYRVKYSDSIKPVPETNPASLNKIHSQDLSRLSVLVVDDIPLNLLVMKSMLKKLGINAVTANNAHDALAKIAKNSFDYVLTDLWMPTMNGVELAGQIRRNYINNTPLIAVVTADLDGKDHFDFSVFDAVLTKPITVKSLEIFFLTNSYN